ncbi:MAG: hypothetical protein Q8Q67_03295 [bacterium]|nr:hypothetical protein [bacterium]
MRYSFLSEKFLKKALISITAFCALSAIGGGIALIYTDGLGMPREWLGQSFTSYLIPGLTLLIVVGGTNLAAFILIKRDHHYAMESAMVAGFGLQIWIYTEMYIIRQSDWLHTLYFSLSTLILILAFLLFGQKRND